MMLVNGCPVGQSFVLLLYVKLFNVNRLGISSLNLTLIG